MDESGSSDEKTNLVLDEKTTTTNDDVDDETIDKEKRSVWRSMGLILSCILFVTSPLNAIMGVATSLLHDDKLGITSLAVGGVLQVVSSALFVSFATKVWGLGRMLTVSMTLVTVYIASYAFPAWYTIIPASFLLGVGQALLSCCIFVRAAALSYRYSRVANSELDTVLATISGLVNGALNGGHLIGNGLLFAILENPEANNSHSGTTDDDNVCGAAYCNEDLGGNKTAMQQPVAWRYYTMVAVFTVMSAVGLVLSLFVMDEPSSPDGEVSKTTTTARRNASEYFSVVRETWSLLKDSRGYLLVPISLFIGFEQSMLFSDFTQAYVSCSIGIPKVGLVMLTHGLVQLLIASCQGLLVKLLGRPTAVFTGLVLLVACLLTLRLWSPNSQQEHVFYLIAIMWAAGDSILMSNVSALSAVLFEDDPGGIFSLGCFWIASGLMIAYGWSGYLCMAVKLYILMGAAVVAGVSYAAVESGKINRTKNNLAAAVHVCS